MITASLAAAMLFTLGGLLSPWLRASVGPWLVLAPVLLLLALSDD